MEHTQQLTRHAAAQHRHHGYVLRVQRRHVTRGQQRSQREVVLLSADQTAADCGCGGLLAGVRRSCLLLDALQNGVLLIRPLFGLVVLCPEALHDVGIVRGVFVVLLFVCRPHVGHDPCQSLGTFAGGQVVSPQVVRHAAGKVHRPAYGQWARPLVSSCSHHAAHELQVGPLFLTGLGAVGLCLGISHTVSVLHIAVILAQLSVLALFLLGQTTLGVQGTLRRGVGFFCLAPLLGAGSPAGIRVLGRNAIEIEGWGQLAEPCAFPSVQLGHAIVALYNFGPCVRVVLWAPDGARPQHAFFVHVLSLLAPALHVSRTEVFPLAHRVDDPRQTVG